MEPLLKTGLSLIGNVLKKWAKSVLIRLEFIVAASATVRAIHKKTFGSGCIAKVSGHTRPSDLALWTKFLMKKWMISWK